MGGTARLVSGELAGLDRLAVDAVVLPLYAGRRQPLGAAGYIDWRLSGRIARLLLKGQFAGSAGEVLLMPALGRFGAERLFLFGLGAAKALSEAETAARVVDMARVLAEARVERVALAPPELPGATPEVAQAERTRLLVRWLEVAAASKPPIQELMLLDAGGALARQSQPLEEAAKRAGWSWQGAA